MLSTTAARVASATTAVDAVRGQLKDCCVPKPQAGVFKKGLQDSSNSRQHDRARFQMRTYGAGNLAPPPLVSKWEGRGPFGIVRLGL